MNGINLMNYPFRFAAGGSRVPVTFTLDVMRRCFAVLLLCGATLGPVATLPAQATTTNGDAVLIAGDAVRITVWRRPELSGEFLVAATGSLTHPLYREIRVTGVPLSAVEEQLQSFLTRLESNPQFSIQPLFRVAVGGEVRQPSLYSLPPETTIAQAVALAGGLTERGRLDRVRLMRDGQTIYVDLAQSGAGTAVRTVRSGDQILVDRRTSVFRDYIAPASSVVSAALSVLRFLVR